MGPLDVVDDALDVGLGVGDVESAVGVPLLADGAVLLDVGDGLVGAVVSAFAVATVASASGATSVNASADLMAGDFMASPLVTTQHGAPCTQSDVTTQDSVARFTHIVSCVPSRPTGGCDSARSIRRRGRRQAGRT